MRYNRSQIEAQKKKKPLRHFRSTPQQEQPVVIPTPFPAEEKKPEEPAKEEAPEEKPKIEHKKNLKIKHKEKVKEEKPQSEQKEAKSTNTNPSEEQLEAFKKKIKEILQQ